MPLLTQPSFGPKLSIILIIVGALMDVWVLVWRYTVAPDPLSANARFWYMGILLTGLTLLVVGLLIGQIGRAARKAELPPPEAQGSEAAIQQTAAANGAVAPVVPAVQPGMPVQAPVMPAPVAPATPPAGIAGVQQPYATTRR